MQLLFLQLLRRKIRLKELELFYLTNCPYCRFADKAIEELQEENPAFREISIRRIEENQEPKLAAQRDYYYVPSFFLNSEKLYEAQPGQDMVVVKENVRRVFETVVSKD